MPPSSFRRALALLSLLLVAQLTVLRGVMACAEPEAMGAAARAGLVAHGALGAHAAHGASHDHQPGHSGAGHLPGSTCPAMTVCALAALPTAQVERTLPPAARAERIAGPESPRAWAPRAPEPPPPRG